MLLQSNESLETFNSLKVLSLRRLKTAGVAENGMESINGIKGVWLDNTDLEDNLKTFNDLIQTKVKNGSMTEKQAALETFTGKMAKRKGFGNVDKIVGDKNEDGTYKRVLGVFFIR